MPSRSKPETSSVVFALYRLTWVGVLLPISSSDQLRIVTSHHHSSIQLRSCCRSLTLRSQAWSSPSDTVRVYSSKEISLAPRTMRPEPLKADYHQQPYLTQQMILADNDYRFFLVAPRVVFLSILSPHCRAILSQLNRPSARTLKMPTKRVYSLLAPRFLMPLFNTVAADCPSLPSLLVPW